jgi:putative DNA primase/helicase
MPAAETEAATPQITTAEEIEIQVVHKVDDSPSPRHALTELGNSQRLVDAFGDNIRYCHQHKSWYIWTGEYWKRDETGQIIELMKVVAERIFEEIKTEPEEEKRQRIIKWCASSQRRNNIENSIALARSVVPVMPEEFNADPHLLNVSNGTLDLRTGTLRPHRREDFISKMCPVEYRPGAKCPQWEKFISEIMPDRETQEYLQRAVGYTLTGSNAEHVFFVLWGSGRNGKSTFLKTVQALMGDYAKQADFQSFTEGQSGGIRNDIARLEGARLVCATEGKQNGRLAENVIKFLTGGDKVAARFLYQEHREFEPQMKLWLGTNHRPRIVGTDVAIWSRVRLIPFTESFLGREDRDLGDKLLKELPGILNWALEGLEQYQLHGLNEPEHVKLATQEYQKDSDQIGRFIAACTARGTEDTLKKAMYSRYKIWASDNGEYQFTERAFSESMGEHGYQDRHTMKGMVWVGLKLVA